LTRRSILSLLLTFLPQQLQHTKGAAVAAAVPPQEYCPLGHCQVPLLGGFDSAVPINPTSGVYVLNVQAGFNRHVCAVCGVIYAVQIEQRYG